MKSAEKMMNAMSPGKVYRRQQLEDFSKAVDRDLKTLLDTREVIKLSGGLYYRPRKNIFGTTPPEDKTLIKAFLKTNDFLLTSYTHYNQLGLGLTQIYNNYVVYNHKRAGLITLGGKYFNFRLVPAYPRYLSKEYLLVDLFNNLKRLPDDMKTVIKNIKSRLSDFDHEAVNLNLKNYGNSFAHKLLRETYA
jgi:hypothetical protein